MYILQYTLKEVDLSASLEKVVIFWLLVTFITLILKFSLSDDLVLVEAGDADVAQVQDGLAPQVLQGVTPLQLQLFQPLTN